MKERFEIPKKWCVKAKTKTQDKVLTDYIVNTFNVELDYDDSLNINTWFTNTVIDGTTDYYHSFTSKPPNNTVEITYAEFIKYVLNGEKDPIISDEPEDLTQLKELLLKIGV